MLMLKTAILAAVLAVLAGCMPVTDSRLGVVPCSERCVTGCCEGDPGDVLTVDFTVLGLPCVGLNGGSAFQQTEAFSFQVLTDNQEETDRYWNAIVGNGGQESACGWCKDRWGVSWQITPRVLINAVTSPDPMTSKRAFEAMMEMRKIDIAAIEAAIKG